MTKEKAGWLMVGIFFGLAAAYFGITVYWNTTENGRGARTNGESVSAPPADKILWVTRTEETFQMEYPVGWEYTQLVQNHPEAARFVANLGGASFAVMPNGEFDYGLPQGAPEELFFELDQQTARRKTWRLSDGTWFSLVTLESGGDFRVELRADGADAGSQDILLEMLERFVFLP